MDTENWQRALADSITDPAELLAALRLDPALLPAARAAAQRFPLRVTRHYLSLMRAGDPHDPLLRQVLPHAEELTDSPGFVTDPVGDLAASAGGGLLQKYQGRALIIATGACAIHCRYCFRRHFPYGRDSAGRQTDGLLSRLQADPGITEIILSGGDPLSLSDGRLAELIRQLGALPQLRRLRLHTRLPVVLPQRLTTRLADSLGDNPLSTSVVLHVNHPAELCAELAAALTGLRARGVALLNQSVLLAGVNDDADTLQALSEALFDVGVMPYYVHLLDRVAGAAHFGVDDGRASALQSALQARLPGYLVPRFVREHAGGTSKTPLAMM